MERLKPIMEAAPTGQWKDWIFKAYNDRISLSATGYYWLLNVLLYSFRQVTDSFVCSPLDVFIIIRRNIEYPSSLNFATVWASVMQLLSFSLLWQFNIIGVSQQPRCGYGLRGVISFVFLLLEYRRHF